jgi:O-antigen ligase
MTADSVCFSSGLTQARRRFSLADFAARFALMCVQALVASPVPLFLITLTAMLFRPPDLEFHSIDRFAFGLLVLATSLRALALRQRLYLSASLLVPMAGLSFLALLSLVFRTFDAITWSVLAARIFVPCAMFLLTQWTFADERSVRWLERFLMVVLAYLSWTAVATLAGAQELIFPRFILDESLGIHADRARGPFLQAVANGVSLNLLGLLALDLFRRGRLRGLWAACLLIPLPVAIVATKTRAVWVSFAASIAWASFRNRERRLRVAMLALVGVAGAALLAAACLSDCGQDLADRLGEEGTVEFRMAAYQAGWEMFLQKPLAGWGTSAIQFALADRIRDFKGEAFAVHNTYIQILLEQGILGFLLSVWLMAGFHRLGRVGASGRDDLTASVRALWPALLAVYLVNATFVVMNYQFVNSLLFVFAGLLAVRRQSAAGMT